jgi:hypothetical protein
MKTFRFTGLRTLDETFFIDVEAESLEEAQEIIDEGDGLDEYGHRTEYVDGSEEFEFLEEVGDEDDDE